MGSIKDGIKGLLRTERSSVWEDLLPKEWFGQPEPLVVAGQFSNAEYGNFIKQINEEVEATNWRALQDSQRLREHIEKYAKGWHKHWERLLFNHIYFEILDRLPEGVTTEESVIRLIDNLRKVEDRLFILQGDKSENKEVINRAQMKIKQILGEPFSPPELVKSPEKPEQKLVDKIAEEAPQKIEPKQVKPPDKPKQKLVDKMAEEALQKIEPKQVKPPEKPKQSLAERMVEEAPQKIDPKQAKPPEKPKQSLAERMVEEAEKARQEAENGEEKDREKPNDVVEFSPLILKASLEDNGCRLVDIRGVVWDEEATDSPMQRTHSLSGASGYFISPDEQNQTKNQDLLAVVREYEDGLTRVFVFDGVSNSLRPREWAEALLESALEMGLGVESTKNDEILSKWYYNSVEKWRNWIEQEYESKRERKAIWIEEQRIRDAHSTLTILEIGKESVEIAQVGDSPFFAYNSVNKKSLMAPDVFDHQSGPQTIGTDRLFLSEELSYLKLDCEEWDYYIACTDSIGDYLNENLGDIDRSVNFLESMLGDNPQGILCDMIARGRGPDGLIEDDLSLFVFTKHIIGGSI